jgi:HEAT repeat protein
MKTEELSSMTPEALIGEYIDVSCRQADAIDMHEMREVKRLFDRLAAIEDVLGARGPEALRSLIPLLKHRNAQVRLNAAKELMSVAPAEARATLEDLAARGPTQQSGDAGMHLLYIDRGTLKPI